MAGVDMPQTPDLRAHSGPLSALARSQYRALAAMRWSMFRNSARSTQGAIEIGARTIATVIYSIVGIGLAAGLGSGAYLWVAADKWAMVTILFWIVFVVWQVIPISLASFQEQFDMGSLLRFPVGFSTFFLLHLIFGLVDISSIMGGFCCLGLLAGIVAARPGMALWAALVLLAYAAFNVFMVRAVFAWIERWLAQRRSREIMGALFLVALLAVQLVNPLLRSHTHRQMSAAARATSLRWLRTAYSVQRWLPPGLAAVEIERAAEHRPANAVVSVAALSLFALAAGGVLAVRLRAEYRGENFSDVPSRKETARPRDAWFLDGSGPIAAVMEKELRTLMRSLPLLYGIGAPLLMVFLISGLYRNRAGMGGSYMSVGLLVSVAYAIVGFTPMIYNNLGPDGAGVQVMFLSPTPIRTVILAKNLFHSSLFLIDIVLVCLFASVRLGRPSPTSLAATAAWVLFALPVHLAAGNAFSLRMAYRTNLGRIGRQRGSQASAVLAMAIQVGVLGVGVGIFLLCAFFNKLWVSVPVLLVLAAVAVFAWMRGLNSAGAVANQRREALITTLVKTE